MQIGRAGERAVDRALAKSSDAVSLRGKQLGAVPAAVLGATFARSLNLGFNQLAALPAGLARLRLLERLELRNNALEELPEVLAELPALRELHAAHNALARLPRALPGALVELSLGHNRLRALPGAALAELGALEVLRVQGNELEALPHELWDLPALRLVNAERNRLQWLSPLVVDAPALPRENGDYYWQDGLRLEGNPLVEPPLAVARRGFAAIRDYFVATEARENALGGTRLLVAGCAPALADACSGYAEDVQALCGPGLAVRPVDDLPVWVADAPELFACPATLCVVPVDLSGVVRAVLDDDDAAFEAAVRDVVQRQVAPWAARPGVVSVCLAAECPAPPEPGPCPAPCPVPSASRPQGQPKPQQAQEDKKRRSRVSVREREREATFANRAMRRLTAFTVDELIDDAVSVLVKETRAADEVVDVVFGEVFRWALGAAAAARHVARAAQALGTARVLPEVALYGELARPNEVRLLAATRFTRPRAPFLGLPAARVLALLHRVRRGDELRAAADAVWTDPEPRAIVDCAWYSPQDSGELVAFAARADVEVAVIKRGGSARDVTAALALLQHRGWARAAGALIVLHVPWLAALRGAPGARPELSAEELRELWGMPRAWCEDLRAAVWPPVPRLPGSSSAPVLGSRAGEGLAASASAPVLAQRRRSAAGEAAASGLRLAVSPQRSRPGPGPPAVLRSPSSSLPQLVVASPPRPRSASVASSVASLATSPSTNRPAGGRPRTASSRASVSGPHMAASSSAPALRGGARRKRRAARGGRRGTWAV